MNSVGNLVVSLCLHLEVCQIILHTRISFCLPPFFFSQRYLFCVSYLWANPTPPRKVSPHTAKSIMEPYYSLRYRDPPMLTTNWTVNCINSDCTFEITHLSFFLVFLMHICIEREMHIHTLNCSLTNQVVQLPQSRQLGKVSTVLLKSGQKLLF